MKGKVDEVIVVDTGSTDGTVEIARGHGADISSFAWCDDFAAARNASIERAHGDWIVWVDADEELIEASPDDLRRLCEAPQQPEGFLLTCRNLLNSKGDCNSEIRQWRLFRNRLGLCFHGRIHEHLLHADGRTDADLLFQDMVWIRHWGYIPDPQRTERKRTRNHRLLEMALRDEPTNPFINYNLGKQYVADHQFAQGLPWLERAIQLWQAKGAIPHAYVDNMFTLAINSAVELGDLQCALRIEQLVPETAISPDILFQAGAAWLRLGQCEEAERRLLRAWQDTSIRNHIEGDPSSSTWRPLAALAQLELDRGNAQKAYEYACEGIAYGPGLPNLLYALALTSAKLKRFNESVEHARKLIVVDADEGYKRKARRIIFNVGRITGNRELVLEACSGPVEGLSDSEVRQAQADAGGQPDQTLQFSSNGLVIRVPRGSRDLALAATA